MCLSRVTKRIKRPTNRIVRGFKVFDLLDGELHFEFASLNDSSRVPTGKWLRCGERRFKHSYAPGFHFFFTREDVEKWGGVAYAVKVRKVHTIGEQKAFSGSGRLKIGVATELYVPRQRTKRKR